MKIVAAFVLGAVLLTGCTEPDPTVRTVSRAELEKQVTALYPPKNAATTVTVACAGDLAAEVGATQVCHLEVDGDPADVRVSVTSVKGDDTLFNATPVVPADRVAQTIVTALLKEGYEVESVECDAELVGVVDEQVSCTASPANGDGTVVATVTSVKGLEVRFRYEILSES